MQDWNDLRFFLTVAEHGSTLAASAVRQTSQSTVFRRIAALEEAMGVTLFDRKSSGYVLTPAGTDLLPLARNVEAAIAELDDAAARERRRQTTIIRFSAPDVTVEYLLPTITGPFRDAYPEVQVELLASDRKLDLAKGEADVALRANPASNETEIFGRRVAYERPMLVASRTYVERHGLPCTEAQLADHNFISLTSNLAGLLADWFVRHVPRNRILLQPDSFASILSAVRSGLGISVMPQFICDRDPLLVTSSLRLPLPQFEMWLVSHSRLRGSPTVRAFMEMIGKYIGSSTIDRTVTE